MLQLNTNIAIGRWEFPYCVDVEIQESIDTLTDTCRITIPRKMSWGKYPIALGDEPYIKRKDKVVVKAGYDGNMEVEFIGYVKNVKAGTPVTIECEDSMFLLKEGQVSKHFPAATLKQILDFIVPKGIDVVAADVSLGSYRIGKVSPAKVLEDLKSRYGIYSYFRLVKKDNEVIPVLYSGLAYWMDNRKTESFEFEHNIINYADLVYRREEDMKIKVKAIGVSRDNKRTEVEVGESDGELRTLFKYNMTDAAALKKFAEAEMGRFRYTGYTGNFLTFGEPSVRKGDVVKITGNKYHPDSVHMVPKVTKQIGVSRGYKQIIEPREKANV